MTKAGLDGGVAVGLLAATPACRRGLPAHLGVEPDRQRAPALERFVIGRPIRGLVGRGCRSAHPSQLPCWIRKMNPSRDLCNKAGMARPLCSFTEAAIHPSRSNYDRQRSAGRDEAVV